MPSIGIAPRGDHKNMTRILCAFNSSKANQKNLIGTEVKEMKIFMKLGLVNSLAERKRENLDKLRRAVEVTLNVGNV